MCVRSEVFICVWMRPTKLFVLPFPHPPSSVCGCLGCMWKIFKQCSAWGAGAMKGCELSDITAALY